jgi:Beta-propeller repeat
VYSTFLGDAGASAIVPDAAGSAWLAGGAGGDVYVARLNPAGSALDQEIRFGGENGDVANDIALDGAGNPYVTGHTYSADFPTTPGAFDRVWGGDTMIFWGDAFVAKLDPGGTAPPPPPPPPPPLAAPALVGPADSASVAQPVTFDWTDVPEAASYTIQVDEGSAFGQPLILSSSTTGSQFTTSSLPESPWFWFWRVRAVRADGSPGTWSEVRMIDVLGAPSPPPPPPPPPPPTQAPSLLSPSSDARFRPGQSITFDWSDVAGTTTYTLQIDDSESFSAPQLVAHTTAESRYATSTLPERRMWWRVRADGGPWSGARRFEVKD